MGVWANKKNIAPHKTLESHSKLLSFRITSMRHPRFSLSIKRIRFVPQKEHHNGT